ncbi:uncharacterized protein LOC141899437 [Tubulanus polymorphus]|uniref:uncharacterized protein LOC141899437 n=1 Tax=Tubulanus polymorphus TaxID=672921 RepID=UPI003DA2B81B
MCQLNTLRYGFRWFNDRAVQPKVTSPIDQPSKILHLDISVNDIRILDYDGLVHFHNLRSLNASINRITNCSGIEVCRQLRCLNLSHNFLQSVISLSRCLELRELHLSMNRIVDIKDMPILSNLTKLHLDHNDIETLEGIQVLANLRELFIQKNKIKSILPTSACTELVSINADENLIEDLVGTCESLRRLGKLELVSFRGNPMQGHKRYREAMISATTINLLDGQNVRIGKMSTEKTLIENVQSIADVAKQIHDEQIHHERKVMMEDIALLQRRILMRQQEFAEYEQRMKGESEACIAHLSHLPENFPKVIVQPHGLLEKVKEVPMPSQYGLPITPEHEKHKKNHLQSEIRDTDEVLRHAFNQLTVEQTKRDQERNA